jgi:hypothetical protein
MSRAAWLMATALFLVTAVSPLAARSARDDGRHPANARAAADCSTLFADAGDFAEAEFFASLAQQEDFVEPEAIFAIARLTMRRGQPIDSEVRRAVERQRGHAPRAARLMLRGAADLIAVGTSTKWWNAAAAVRAAVELDPSLQWQAESWVLSVVRAQITTRNAGEMATFLVAAIPRAPIPGRGMSAPRVSAPRVVAMQIEIAERALQIGSPGIAAFYATQALAFETTEQRRLAAILVRAAHALQPKRPDLAHEAARIALARDPERRFDEELLWLVQATARCGRGEFLKTYVESCARGRYIAEARRLLSQEHSVCSSGLTASHLGLSPFLQVDGMQAETRFFTAQPTAIAPAVPATATPADFPEKARRCRSLAPPLFPEPFDGHREGVTAEEEIGGRSAGASLPKASPCVAEAHYERDVDRTGEVVRVVIRSARFEGSDRSDPLATAAAEKQLVPFLRSIRYRPAMIRGVPVVSRVRGGVQHDCSE